MTFWDNHLVCVNENFNLKPKSSTNDAEYLGAIYILTKTDVDFTLDRYQKICMIINIILAQKQK